MVHPKWVALSPVSGAHTCVHLERGWIFSRPSLVSTFFPLHFCRPLILESGVQNAWHPWRHPGKALARGARAFAASRLQPFALIVTSPLRVTYVNITGWCPAGRLAPRIARMCPDIIDIDYLFIVLRSPFGRTQRDFEEKINLHRDRPSVLEGSDLTYWPSYGFPATGVPVDGYGERVGGLSILKIRVCTHLIVLKDPVTG